jgi:alpha-D-ribose 1-methylphosphonate 5-triphosphate diphosphatase PhnM
MAMHWSMTSMKNISDVTKLGLFLMLTNIYVRFSMIQANLVPNNLVKESRLYASSQVIDFIPARVINIILNEIK